MTETRKQTNQQIKVLIVDDSAFYRQALSKLLETSLGIQVIGSVADGAKAIRFLSQGKPDVIVLDLEMPEMDGFTFLRWLMKDHPLPVVVVSSRTGTADVFKALELGALDFLAKPTQRAFLEISKIRQELVTKVELAATVPIEKLLTKAKMVTEPLKSVSELSRPTAFHKAAGLIEVVTIGASTGGPPAVRSILTRLPQNLSTTIAIAQHMPPGFTQYFAKRLDKICGLPVKEASHGEVVQSGTIYVAPGGYHMVFKKGKSDIRFSITPKLESDKYSPSVNVLMKSAAQVYGNKVLGVLLTGMGQDGKEGMRTIKEMGGVTMAEAEETAVIFGMPREAILEGVVDKILPLYNIPDEIIRWCC